MSRHNTWKRFNDGQLSAAVRACTQGMVTAEGFSCLRTEMCDPPTGFPLLTVSASIRAPKMDRPEEVKSRRVETRNSTCLERSRLPFIAYHISAAASSNFTSLSVFQPRQTIRQYLHLATRMFLQFRQDPTINVGEKPFPE
jgi:hypothetical protein